MIEETTTQANGAFTTTAYAYGLERIAAYRTENTTGSASNNITHYVYDGRGSVAQTMIAHVAGESVSSALPNVNVKVQSFSYTAFGEQMDSTKVSGFAYNAEAFDAATGMLNLRARQYEALENRFIQKDASRGNIHEPTSLFRYTFCLNTPTMFVDANGRNATPAPATTPAPPLETELQPLPNPPPPETSDAEDVLNKLYALSQGNFGSNRENLIGIDTATIIYDGREDQSEGGKGFPNQAKAIEREYTDAGVNVEMKSYTNIDEFTQQFNTTSNTDLFVIVAHGSPDTLDIDGKYLKDGVGEDEPSAIEVQTSLSKITVNEGVLLYSCNGATPNKQGKTTAEWIAERTGGSPVLAANTSVKYEPHTGHPIFSASSTSKNPIVKFVEKVFSTINNWINAAWSVTKK